MIWNACTIYALVNYANCSMDWCLEKDNKIVATSGAGVRIEAILERTNISIASDHIIT